MTYRSWIVTEWCQSYAPSSAHVTLWKVIHEECEVVILTLSFEGVGKADSKQYFSTALEAKEI